MNLPLLIQSRNNPRIKSAASLKDAKNRRKTGLFAVEGLHEFKTVLSYQFPVKEIFCEENQYPKIASLLENMSAEVHCSLVKKAVLEKISIRQNPDTLVAICEQREIPPITGIDGFDQPILILDALENPGNLGAILRSSAAFGFSHIVLNESMLDPFHPNVIRNSRGHSLGIKMYRDTPENTAQWLTKNNYDCYVATPESPDEISTIRFQNKTAIVLGNEHDGVGKFWRRFARKGFNIPMKECVDSLNVSVSASIVLYEVFKQLKSKF